MFVEKKAAGCEDRTHDLRIMRPTLFQLSQTRLVSTSTLTHMKAVFTGRRKVTERKEARSEGIEFVSCICSNTTHSNRWDPTLSFRPFHTFGIPRSIMAETGFDPRRSKIGEKALCDFIDQEVTGNLLDV